MCIRDRLKGNRVSYNRSVLAGRDFGAVNEEIVKYNAVFVHDIQIESGPADGYFSVIHRLAVQIGIIVAISYDKLNRSCLLYTSLLTSNKNLKKARCIVKESLS